MSFPFFLQKHDPDSQEDWSSPPFQLNEGESIASATVTVVDGADNPIDNPDLIVFDVTFASLGNNQWQVTFWLRGGLPGGVYILRFRILTDSIPARKFDRSRRMRCRQT